MQTAALDLSPAQLAAVESDAPRILCVAGPGSGKTRVLAMRIQRLVVGGLSPWNILALTFSRRAAGELRARVVTDDNGMRHLSCSTFHAFAVRLLREWGGLVGHSREFSIYDDEDRADLLRQIIEDLNLKISLRACDRPEGGLDWQRVHDEYRARLRVHNAIDYDGLLDLATSLLRDHPEVLARYHQRFRHVLVDEAQDTDPKQWEILGLLDPGNLFVVGDYDQSIYRFRGASPENVMTFADTSSVVHLADNYRSTRQIVRAAGSLIRRNHSRIGLPQAAHADGPDVHVIPCLDRDDEADQVGRLISCTREVCADLAWSDIAVLARTNAQLERLAGGLAAVRGIPSRAVSGDYWRREEVRGILAYLKLVHNPADSLALRQVVAWPDACLDPRGLAETRLMAARDEATLFDAAIARGTAARERLTEIRILRQRIVSGEVETAEETVREIDRALGLSAWFDSRGLVSKAAHIRETFTRIADWQALFPEDHSLASFVSWLAMREIQDEIRASEDAVHVMTAHAAKGLEWRMVVIAGAEEGLFPHRMSRGEEAIEDERRLFYVAMTRAKEILVFTHASETGLETSRRALTPSRFLGELTQREGQ